MIFILIVGIITSFTIKTEVFPEASLDLISISVAYPGASPSEIEESIVRKIEENIAGLTGVKSIDSSSVEGAGSITVEVMDGWDTKELLDDIKSEVDRINTLPENAEAPVIKQVVAKNQVINIAVYGNASESVIKHFTENLKDDITNLPDITLAALQAVRDPEIHIEISENTLRKYNLTLSQVANTIKQASLNLPGGSVKTSGGEILIRAKGTRYYADDYNDITILTRNDGTRVTLGQIAVLKNGFEDVDTYFLFQGKRAAMLMIYRVANQNALTVARQVKEYINKIKPTIPEGINIATFGDMSVLLKSRMNLLSKNMLMGLILVSICLGFFLSFRLSFWVTIGIPVSFMFGLSLLPRFDVSINMISLFGFIMVLGIVVDDAIIVGENIFRKRDTEPDPQKSAIMGCTEVGPPVIFSVLTTIVAFWPLLLGTGGMGKMLRALPVVVIAVLLGSLIESLFILPSHLSGKVKNKTGHKKEKKMSLWLRKFINGPYNKILSSSLKWRYAVVSFGFFLLFITIGMWHAGIVKFIFFPKVEGDSLKCSLTMPTGTPVYQTEKIVKNLEKAGLEVISEISREQPENSPEILEYSMTLMGFHVGGRRGSTEAGGHLGQVWIQLSEGEKRTVSADKLIRLWREKVGTIPEAESITFSNELHSGGVPIAINLSMEDHDQLLQAKNDLKKIIGRFNGVFDIQDSFLSGKTEMQLKLKPSARNLGLTLSDLATQVRSAFYGAEALRIQRDKDEVKVIVRYPENERHSMANIEKMRIRTNAGFEIPFSQVAQIQLTTGYSKIERSQRKRVIQVSADVDEKKANANEIRNQLQKKYLPELLSHYPGLRYTIEGEGKNQAESLKDVIQGFMVAIFCIYALLAIPFKSFSQPLIIMGAIPFGFVGAIWGHIIMGYNLSILSLFGCVGLTGVVVNDSLVLIHAINRIRTQGVSLKQAVLNGGALRFRAILLTSVTTFAGLTPILLEKSLQAQFLIPMAVSLGFGVLFATSITLLLIPCGYMILDDIQNLIVSLKKNSLNKMNTQFSKVFRSRG